MQLDTTTLFIVLGLAQVASLVFSLVLWASKRVFPGAGIWVVGQACVVAGTIGTLFLRDFPIAFVGIALTNMVTFAGIICMFASIWRFRHGRRPPWWVWLALPLYLAIMTGMLGSSVNLRIVVYSVFVGGATLVCGITLVLGAEPKLRMGCWLTSLAFLIMVPVHFLRAVLALTGPEIRNLGQQGELSSWLYLIAVFAAYLLLFGYFVLTSLRYEAELRSLNETNLFMMSVISHDLRSPIRSAARYVDRHLLPGTVNLTQKRDALRILGQSLKNSSVLLDHLLGWAQERQHPDSPGKREVFGVLEVVEPALAMVADTIREKSLVVTLPGKSHPVIADRQLAASVFRNLLSNAVFHVEEKGCITITCDLRDGMVAVGIADDGPGIHPQLVDRLREGGSVPRLFGNAGDASTSLGLVLCHRFMRRQGGWLEIESSVGEGSRFTPHFPAAF